MKKERNYRRISWTFRLKIEALYNAGHSFRFIAHQTGFAPSSIHNEIQHGLYPHMGAETTKRPEMCIRDRSCSISATPPAPIPCWMNFVS